MASFEEEWARLKDGAADGPGMRLASAGDGGAEGGVKSSKTAWTAAGSAVGGLCGNAKKVLTSLETGQHGLATDGGVETAAAQSEVYQSWKTYLDKLSGRCTTLQGNLERAGKDLLLTDESVKGLFVEMGKQYRDTPAVGGEGK
ncbi:MULTISPECIES: hypothetical protein [Streptomyces violaceusniger group]|uniref:Uncharacterized protein n=1 Tax=Streptomyces malaysiensis TaxID=92644 RepID=A0A2J7ZB48_STRMQ|nr:hypothetical protein [Streptomyces malaysiensis]MCQ6244148.1 hypothetical protein [Streptomyces malaysiensis]PNG97500.1 hypothetical protein SMF913_13525 [Streptomyces malaysiensis]